MGVYLINFLVYSMAMVGLLFVCLMVYKKTMVDNRFNKNENELKIENALNLSQRKTLYVVKAGDEKFLIASDTERTSFLAKLHQNDSPTTNNIVRPESQNYPQQEIKTSQRKAEQKIDYSEVMAAIRKTNTSKQPVMKEMARKLSQPLNIKH